MTPADNSHRGLGDGRQNRGSQHREKGDGREVEAIYDGIIYKFKYVPYLIDI